MATIKEIRAYVKERSGFKPSSCQIAHVKELCGLDVRRAWNRQGEERLHPCPSEKRPAIEEAMRQLGMIK